MNHKPVIAIVGMGGVFSRAGNPEALWRIVESGENTAQEPPAGRWALELDQAYDPTPGAADRVYSRRAHFIERPPERLDSFGLALDAETLDALDPQAHLLLAAGVQAWRDAVTRDVNRARTGVVIGNIALPSEKSSELSWAVLGRTFEERVRAALRIAKMERRDAAAATFHPLHARVAGLPAGVLAHALGLGAGSMALDAACASSLYAIKLSMDELQSNRADAMLAGGLSRPDSLYTQMGFSQLRAISPHGRCSPFDEKGDGLVVGEGAGIFVLKRLDDALRDGDRIYATLHGAGLSNDIGGSLLAPIQEGQLRALRAAYEQAGWRPADVDLIECHATGTPVGDAVEFGSLCALWEAEQAKPGQCVIGSVKSNIGHCLTAAGSAALMKTLLALRHETLPPTANFERPPQSLGMERSPFRVLQSSEPWERRAPERLRRAAVSAFGFGGINAHILLQEWDEALAEQSKDEGIRASFARVKSADAQPKAAVPSLAERELPPSPVAIVGMAARIGPWRNLRAFQERALGGGEDCPPSLPEHWNGVERSEWFQRLGFNAEQFRGWRIGELDVPLDQYRIPPKELEEMLPQQLLMLETAAAAMRDAGFERGADDNRHVRSGVIIGVGLDLNTTNFHVRWLLENKAREWARESGARLSEDELRRWIEALRESCMPHLTANRTMGALASVAASRIAREFRFGSPSYTVSNEDGAGLAALEKAVRMLRVNEADFALAGAVDLAGDARLMLAAGARPDAPVGEGAVCLALKRLDDARRDGDRIYAVIEGLGAASGGGHFGAPGREAYLSAARAAMHEANIEPRAIMLHEAGFEANPETDRAETEALAELYAGQASEDAGLSSVRLGCVKADFGRTGAVSGLASTAKAALSLYQEMLPPARDARLARLDSSSAANRLNTGAAPQYWLNNRAKGPRRAMVTGRSVDGNCACVALAEFPKADMHLREPELLQPLGARDEGLFCVEANTAHALAAALGRLRAFVEHRPDDNAETLARAWWHENRQDPNKTLAVALVARNANELFDQIDIVRLSIERNPESALNSKTPPSDNPHVRDRVFYSPDPLGPKGQTAFVFPGSGNHYLDMGREISVQWPEIFRTQETQNAYLRSQFQPELFWNSPREAEESLEEINKNHRAAIFGQVALGTVVSDVVQLFGVRPKAVVGYSLGETAGLFALRAWTGRDLMLQRMNESTLFTSDLVGEYNAVRKAWKWPKSKAVDWALGVIDLPTKTVQASLAAARKDHWKVFQLIANTGRECVIGGHLPDVERFVRQLECEFYPLKGVSAVHCEVAEEVAGPYREMHLFDTQPPQGVRFYSGAWGTHYPLSRDSAADAILLQATKGIDYPKVINAAYDDGVRVFIEMGPGSSCTRMIGEILSDKPHAARSACYSGMDPVSGILRVLGRLIAERVQVDLSVLYGQETLASQHQPAPRRPERRITVIAGGEPFDPPSIQDVLAPRTDMDSTGSMDSAGDTKPLMPERPLAEMRAAGLQEEALKPAAAPEFFEAEAILPPPRTELGVSMSSLVHQVEAAERAQQQAHEQFLQFTNALNASMEDNLRFQLALMEAAGRNEAQPRAAVPQTADGRSELQQTTKPPTGHIQPVQPVQSARPSYAKEKSLLDYDMCMELAIGSLAKAYGTEFEPVDAHPTRVRLPDDPLMLCHRIMLIEGEKLSMTHGRMVTEHDVFPDAWYLDHGRAPVCISVEAGQADLVLSGWLGIDFKTNGLACYRLLDAEVVFQGDLPESESVLRYDIQIKHFFRHNDTWLFRFQFDATCNGRPLMQMRNGCAGFFTQRELDAGEGIVRTKSELAPVPGKRPADWRELAPLDGAEAYDEAQVDALRRGDYAACFGEAFADLPLSTPTHLPTEPRMKLVDRVLELDPMGGRFGLGVIRAEMDVQPDDWFLTCHFSDDMVMPGTLMYECCMHTLRILLMRYGWVGEAERVAWQPIPGVASGLKCRGQVTQETKRVLYEVELKELGYNDGEPYAIAEAMMYVDGKPAVLMINQTVRLTGTTRDELEALWANQTSQLNTDPFGETEQHQQTYDTDHILAFATGAPLGEVFGENFAPLDTREFNPRLPRPPYSFLSRIAHVSTPPTEMLSGGDVIGEYDIPANAWYFDSERQPRMPYSVLLEAGLQTCGWYSAYMGAMLHANEEVHYRNLGGWGVQHEAVTPETGTLTTRVKCTNVAKTGGMVIHNFDFQIFAGERLIYECGTNFGFFTRGAMAQQTGLREAKLYEPSPDESKAVRAFGYPSSAPFPDGKLRMIDRVTHFAPDGGPHGLGWIRGEADVKPEAWFFEAHFYQDPVWPGSLGLESFLQLLKAAAWKRWGGKYQPGAVVFASPGLGERHEWAYRGQILRTNQRVTVDAVITERDDKKRLLRADGLLKVDDLVIYQMRNFALKLI
ncbi:type I polyketide synthase [Candidatus Sumerlaeota bacterium]|nr:type I polyketide synthase [Candidatus Sumerlaeota bacterium]